MKRTQGIRAAALGASLILTMASGGAAYANMTLKGGASRFSSGLDKVTTSGASWGILYASKPASFIAVETGTEGSQNGINDPDSPQTTGLLRLGETTMVRFILPVLPVVHPFIGAGIALDYLMVQGGQSIIGLPGLPGLPGEQESRYNSGMFVHFPFAAGIDFDLSAVTLGIRATYHRCATSPFGRGVNPNFFDLSLAVSF